MKFDVVVTDQDVSLVKGLILAQSSSPIVKVRSDINLAPEKTPIDKDRFWRALVCMRATTRNQTTATSPAGRLSLNPFVLSLEEIHKHNNDIRKLFEIRLSKLRDHETMADQFAENYRRLETGGWERVIAECNRLTVLVNVSIEREVADYLDELLAGIGPKQARNILQALGLTRYEIPLDSRVIKWLRDELDFPFPVNGTVIADKACYHFILDHIQHLCEKSQAFPCILDAAIFSVGDNNPWQAEQLRF